MDTKIKHLFILLSLLGYINTYAQKPWAKEFNWHKPDSIEYKVFENRAQLFQFWLNEKYIISTVDNYTIRERNIIIVKIVWGSGIIRDKIYIYEEKKDQCILSLVSNDIVVSNTLMESELLEAEDKIIFTIDNSVIVGELKFSDLGLW